MGVVSAVAGDFVFGGSCLCDSARDSEGVVESKVEYMFFFWETLTGRAEYFCIKLELYSGSETCYTASANTTTNITLRVRL